MLLQKKFTISTMNHIAWKNMPIKNEQLLTDDMYCIDAEQHPIKRSNIIIFAVKLAVIACCCLLLIAHADFQNNWTNEVNQISWETTQSDC